MLLCICYSFYRLWLPWRDLTVWISLLKILILHFWKYFFCLALFSSSHNRRRTRYNPPRELNTWGLWADNIRVRGTGIIPNKWMFVMFVRTGVSWEWLWIATPVTCTNMPEKRSYFKSSFYCLAACHCNMKVEKVKAWAIKVFFRAQKAL